MSLLNAVPRDILSQTAHRPYPLPRGPWVMRETWSKLLFAHWSLPPRLIKPLLPSGLELDTFANEAYISIIPLRTSGVRLRALPFTPGFDEVPQINVRTYVRRDDKPGIYFLAIDTNHLPTVWLTRALMGLPYHHARMSLKRRFVGYKSVLECVSQRDIKAEKSSEDPQKHATWSREGGALDVSYFPSSEAWHPVEGTLAKWLVERYCLYTVHAGSLLRLDIHHHPWQLQDAEAEFRQQSLLHPMREKLGFDLPLTPNLVHYAERIDALLWLPNRIQRA